MHARTDNGQLRGHTRTQGFHWTPGYKPNTCTNTHTHIHNLCKWAPEAPWHVADAQFSCPHPVSRPNQSSPLHTGQQHGHRWAITLKKESFFECRSYRISFSLHNLDLSPFSVICASASAWMTFHRLQGISLNVFFFHLSLSSRGESIWFSLLLKGTSSMAEACWDRAWTQIISLEAVSPAADSYRRSFLQQQQQQQHCTFCSFSNSSDRLNTLSSAALNC